jgi:hypothetical protein
MQVFIGGVMQASNQENVLVSQDYRKIIAESLRGRWPDIEIFDPLVLNPNSVAYDDERARQTLFAMAAEAARSDLMVAYLPSASMGTALEMYLASQSGVPVVAISPLSANWVVRALAQRIYPTLEGFLQALAGAATPLALVAQVA